MATLYLQCQSAHYNTALRGPSSLLTHYYILYACIFLSNTAGLSNTNTRIFLSVQPTFIYHDMHTLLYSTYTHAQSYNNIAKWCHDYRGCGNSLPSISPFLGVAVSTLRILGCLPHPEILSHVFNYHSLVLWVLGDVPRPLAHPTTSSFFPPGPPVFHPTFGGSHNI